MYLYHDLPKTHRKTHAHTHTRTISTYQQIHICIVPHTHISTQKLLQQLYWREVLPSVISLVDGQRPGTHHGPPWHSKLSLGHFRGGVDELLKSWAFAFCKILLMMFLSLRELMHVLEILHLSCYINCDLMTFGVSRGMPCQKGSNCGHL